MSGHEVLTPPELGRRWRVDPSKVIALIKRGEIPGAFNIALERSGRTQWRIPLSAVEAFECNRSVRPTPKPRRRRRNQQPVTEYF